MNGHFCHAPLPASGVYPLALSDSDQEIDGLKALRFGVRCVDSEFSSSQFSSVRSVQFISGQFSSFSSAQLSSVHLSLVQFIGLGSVQFISPQFSSSQLSSAHLNSVQFISAQFISSQLGPVQLISAQFSSVQFRMVPLHLGRPTCSPSHPSEVSLELPLKPFQCSYDWPISCPFTEDGQSLSSFCTCFLQVIDCGMPLASVPTGSVANLILIATLVCA